MVRFKPTVYTVTEGESVPLMIELNTNFDREVTVELTTNNTSATGLQRK